MVYCREKGIATFFLVFVVCFGFGFGFFFLSLVFFGVWVVVIVFDGCLECFDFIGNVY